MLDRMPARIERGVADPQCDRTEDVGAAAEDSLVGRTGAQDRVRDPRDGIRCRARRCSRARRVLLGKDGLQRARRAEDRLALRPDERRCCRKEPTGRMRVRE